jgi:hypothetical protein
MPKNHILGPKSYLPNPDFVQYIRDELQMKEIKRAREDAGEELSIDEKRFERNLDKRKSTWMNKIFQTTADLIFFLECVATEPDLTEEFKDEYDDLFGFGVEDDKMMYHMTLKLPGTEGYVELNPTAHTIESYRNTFSRLISSMLQIHDHPTTNPDDTTITATYLTQLAVLEKMRPIAKWSIEYTHPHIADRIIDDLQYSLAWIKFVSRPVKLKNHFRRRIDRYKPVLRRAKSSNSQTSG